MHFLQGSNMSPKILFLCSGRRVSLVERFKEAGCEVFCTDIDPYAPTRQIADSFEFTPSFDNKKYFIDCINQMCIKHSIDAIIPLYDEAINICCDAKLKALWFGPNRGYNDILFSKRLSIDFFTYYGLKAPEEVKSWNNKKLVGRDINGCGSKGLHFINSEEEFAASQILYKNSIYTNFIQGKEYTVDCYKNINGSIVGIVPRERIKVRSGEVMVSKTVYHEKIDKEARLIMMNIMTLGPCTLQCIENKDGEIFWIEGNPRFGGGVILTLEASIGKNYIRKILDDIHDIADYDPIVWKENMIMTRADREFFIHE